MTPLPGPPPVSGSAPDGGPAVPGLDAALTRLDDLEPAAVEEHAQAYESVHLLLQEALAGLET